MTRLVGSMVIIRQSTSFAGLLPINVSASGEATTTEKMRGHPKNSRAEDGRCSLWHVLSAYALTLVSSAISLLERALTYWTVGACTILLKIGRLNMSLLFPFPSHGSLSNGTLNHAYFACHNGVVRPWEVCDAFRLSPASTFLSARVVYCISTTL